MKSQKLPAILVVLFLSLFLVSAAQLARYYSQGRQAEAAFAELAQSALPSQETAGTENRSDTVEAPLPAYAPLHEKNPDYWGWLRIEDTAIDYPVMHTPEDPERYLHRDFDGELSSRGVPFLDGTFTEGAETSSFTVTI